MNAPRAKALSYYESLLRRFPELSSCGGDICRVVDAVCASYRAGGKILVCGNGGSASDSEHIVGEMMKGFILPRPLPEKDAARIEEIHGGDAGQLAAHLQRGIPAIALTGHPALATAIGNDTGPALAFAQQVYVLGRPGDVFIGISTSGNSASVVNAAAVARAFGLFTVGMTGEKASRLESLCNVTIKAPASETYRIQEFHLPIYHAVCLMVEEHLFGDEADTED